MSDLIVDTNVLVHVGDERNEELQAAATDLVVWLQHESGVALRADRHPDANTALNTSHIVSEYHEHVRAPNPAAAILAAWLARRRITETSHDVEDAFRRLIRQHVHDPTDHVFVRVTSNSDSRCLVSHDFKVYPHPVKKVLFDALRVEIMSAREYLEAHA